MRPLRDVPRARCPPQLTAASGRGVVRGYQARSDHRNPLARPPRPGDVRRLPRPLPPPAGRLRRPRPVRGPRSPRLLRHRRELVHRSVSSAALNISAASSIAADRCTLVARRGRRWNHSTARARRPYNRDGRPTWGRGEGRRRMRVLVVEDNPDTGGLSPAGPAGARLRRRLGRPDGGRGPRLRRHRGLRPADPRPDAPGPRRPRPAPPAPRARGSPRPPSS